MTRDTARRAELAEAATDYALEHGLIGLSLRPLAAELGTSDRMLLYHFAGKDDLVATVLRTSSDRSVAEIAALPPSRDVRPCRAGPVAALSSAEPLDRCQRMYVEAAALGLLGPRALRHGGRARPTSAGSARRPTTWSPRARSGSARAGRSPSSTPRSWGSSSTCRWTRTARRSGRVVRDLADAVARAGRPVRASA